MTFFFLTLSTFSKFPSLKRAVGMGFELANHGHSVFIALDDCEENRARFDSEAAGCTAVWIKPGSLFREIGEKLSAVRRIKPDFLYSLSYSPRNLAGLSFLFPDKTCYVLEYCELYSSFKFSWLLREWFSLIEVDRLVCASRYLDNVFSSRLRRLHKFTPVIYQPYAYPRYLGGASTRRSKKGCAKKILFMAALWKNYGVYEVIEAYLRVVAVRNNVDLVIIGRGPEYECVDAMIRKKNAEQIIHLEGFVPEEELDSYFADADVFVAPMKDTVQDRARCPSKLFYYIPYNKPIVTCKIGNPYDILGENGFYYNQNDVEDMSRVMSEALDISCRFSYPAGFIDGHTWKARAEEFLRWVR